MSSLDICNWRLLEWEGEHREGKEELARVREEREITFRKREINKKREGKRERAATERQCLRREERSE